MGCLGTDADPAYVPFLREKLVEAIAAAEDNLKPARVGWAVADAADYHRPAPVDSATRPHRGGSVRQPDRPRQHARRPPTGTTSPASPGPEDPDSPLISIQSRDGRPIAVLANFSMHYFGDESLSADYFGLFCEGCRARLAPTAAGDPRHSSASCRTAAAATSGAGLHQPPASRLGTRAHHRRLCRRLARHRDGGLPDDRYRDDVDLAMAESRMTLNYRVPDKQLLEWAQRIVAAMGDRLPKTRPRSMPASRSCCTSGSRPRSSCRRCASATSPSPPRRARPTPSPA